MQWECRANVLHVASILPFLPFLPAHIRGPTALQHVVGPPAGLGRQLGNGRRDQPAGHAGAVSFIDHCALRGRPTAISLPALGRSLAVHCLALTRSGVAGAWPAAARRWICCCRADNALTSPMAGRGGSDRWKTEDGKSKSNSNFRHAPPDCGHHKNGCLPFNSLRRDLAMGHPASSVQETCHAGRVLSPPSIGETIATLL